LLKNFFSIVRQSTFNIFSFVIKERFVFRKVSFTDIIQFSNTLIKEIICLINIKIQVAIFQDFILQFSRIVTKFIVHLSKIEIFIIIHGSDST